MKKNENNIQFLLENVGRLYSCGLNPSVEKFYPRVKYPVSRGTSTISPLVKWEHNQSYTVYQYPHYFNPVGNTDFAVKVDLQVNAIIFSELACSLIFITFVTS